jgi:uncharacterized protein YkwD
VIRRIIRFFFLFGSIIVISSSPAVASAEQDADEARWIHAQLNQWRLGLDLGPLAYNTTLEALAIAQAEYLVLLRRWPSDPHAGRNGEGPRIRARWEPYSWPTYGAAEQILIGEIIWKGTREDALAFWRSSTVHRETATNSRYREVGIAALPEGRGHVFVAVVGARPNVLPALADPYTDSLYLTDEDFGRGTGVNWIQHVDQVRLFDSAGRPLSDDWIPWQAKMELPDDVGSNLFILYSDGDDEVMASVSLLERDIPLPEYADAWQPAVEAVPVVAFPTPTATPPPIPHIRIVYDSRSLTLYNTASSFANVTALELVSGEFVQPVAELNSAQLRGSLRSLPALNCLHITAIGRRAGVPPSECRYASTTTVLSSQVFWTTGDFQVMRDDTLIAECRQRDGICEFDLP